MSAVITSLSHNIIVERNGQEITLKQGDALLESDVITTQGTAIEITFADGTVLSLAPQSSFSIEKAVTTEGEEPLIVIRHTVGTMHVESDLAGVQNAQSFKIISQTLEADVYGTDCISQVLPNGTSEFILLATDKDRGEEVATEGALTITAQDGTSVVLFEPLQSLATEANAALALPQDVQESYAQELVELTKPLEEQTLDPTSQLSTRPYGSYPENLVSQDETFADPISNLATSTVYENGDGSGFGSPFAFSIFDSNNNAFNLIPPSTSTPTHTLSVDTNPLGISEDALQPYQVSGSATWTNMDAGTASPAYGLTDPSAGAMATTQSGLYGSFSLTATGTYTYTLDSAAVQSLNVGDKYTETFTIYVEASPNNILSQEITVTITGENDTPRLMVSTVQSLGSVVEDDAMQQVSKGTLKASTLATDVDTGAVLSFEALSQQGLYGRLVLQNNGSYTYTLDSSLASIQALGKGQTFTDTFTVKITDEHGATVDTQVEVTITGENDTPTLKLSSTQDIGNFTEEATTLTVTDTFDVNSMATDVDKDASLSFVAAKQGGIYGSFELKSDGTYTYTFDNTLSTTQALNKGQIVKDKFTIQITDEHGATVDTQVEVTITGENDAPKITLSNTSMNFAESDEELTATGIITVSDVDEDSDNGSLSKQTLSVGHGLQNESATTAGGDVSIEGTYGTIFINGTTGEYTYTLGYTDEQWARVKDLSDGETKLDIFTVTTTDAHNDAGSDTITVTIEGNSNIAPKLTVQNLTVAEFASQGTSSFSSVVVDQDIGELHTFTVDVGTAPDAASLRPSTPTTTTTVDGIYGELGIVDLHGEYTYTLNADMAKYIGSHETVNETFTVYVKDSVNAVDAKTLSVSIKGDANSTIGYAEAEQLNGLVKNFNDLSSGYVIEEHDGSYSTYGTTNIEIEADVDMDGRIYGDAEFAGESAVTGGNDSISTKDVSASGVRIYGDTQDIMHAHFVAGSDTIMVNGSMSGGSIYGDANSIADFAHVTSTDIITINGNMSGGTLYGDAQIVAGNASITGSDIITIKGTMSLGNIYTDAADISTTGTYDDNDSVTITGGMTGGAIRVARGTDTITINNSNGGSADDYVTIVLSTAVDATVLLDAGGETGDSLTFITGTNTNNTTVYIYDDDTTTQSNIFVQVDGTNLIDIGSSLYSSGKVIEDNVTFILRSEHQPLNVGVTNLDSGTTSFGNDFIRLKMNFDQNYVLYGDNENATTGTGDNDIIILDGNMNNNLSIIVGDAESLSNLDFITGSDDITILGELINGSIWGDVGDLSGNAQSVGADNIIIGAGMSGGSIYGDASSVEDTSSSSGNDTITVHSHMSGGGLYGDASHLYFTASSSDSITVNGNMSGMAFICSDVRFAVGDAANNKTVTISGHDKVIINGSMADSASIYGDSRNVNNKVVISGNDTITIYGNVNGNNVQISGDVYETQSDSDITISGADSITITGEVLDGAIDGDAHDVLGKVSITGADTININILTDADVSGDVYAAEGDITISGADNITINTMKGGRIAGDVIATVKGSTHVSGTDTITILGNLDGGYVFGDIFQTQEASTSDGNDSITVKGNMDESSRIAGDVYSVHSTGTINGDDTITIEGNLGVGAIYGDVRSAHNNVTRITGNDSITIEGNMTGGSIFGDVYLNDDGAVVTGNDTITVKGIMSSVTQDPLINAGAGDDSISVGGVDHGAMGGEIIGGDGKDTITLYVGNTDSSGFLVIDAAGMQTDEFIHLHHAGDGQTFMGIINLDASADYADGSFTVGGVDITSDLESALDSGRGSYTSGDLTIYFA